MLPLLFLQNLQQGPVQPLPAQANLLALVNGNVPVGYRTSVVTTEGTLDVAINPTQAGGSAGTFAIFRPGAPSAAPAYATIAEIQPLIAAAQGAFTIYVDSSLAPAIIPAPAVIDGRSLLVFSPAHGPIGGKAQTLTIADGATLLNPLGFVGQLDVESSTTTIPALVVNNTNPSIIVTFGARLRLLAAGSRPFIDVQPGGANVASFTLDFSSMLQSLAPGIPFAQLLASGSGMTAFYTRLNPFAQPMNNLVAGPIGSTFTMIYDASVTVPSLPNMLGTFTTFQIDNGLVTESFLDFNTAALQAFGGISIAATYPAYIRPVANARLFGADINVVQQVAGPAVTASTAQVVDGFTLHGFTGLADTFAGGTGFTAPPPATLQLAADSTAHLPNLLLRITGNTFANITAGRIQSRILITGNARQTP